MQRLAGDREVAATTQVPHPYEDGVAEEWIGGHEAAFQQGSRMVLAITLRSGELVGAIGLSLDEKHRRGELGYWIGTGLLEQRLLHRGRAGRSCSVRLRGASA